MKKFCLLPFLFICFFISVTSLNIASAWTFSDVIDLARTVDSSLLTTDQLALKNLCINNNYESAIDNTGMVNLDNYHSFCIWSRNNAGYPGLNVYAWGGSTNWSVSGGNTPTNGENISSSYTATNIAFSIYKSSSGGTWSIMTSTTNSPNFAKSIGLYEGASTSFLNSTNLIAQNVYNSIVATNVIVPSGSNVPFLLTQGIVGLNYDITNVSYKLVLKGSSGTQDTFNQDLGAVYSQTGNGHSVNLQLTTLTTLNGYNYYYVDMYYNGSIIYTSDTFTIYYGGSSGGSTSGDSSGGDSSVDLTVTNHKLDNINNSIKSGDAAIISSINVLESGERSRDNWWRDTYNNLFHLSSGDVNDIYSGIKSQFNSGDFVFDYYKPIQDVFERDPDDFVISWGAINLNLTAFNGASLVSGEVIPSGDVNFSKMCRDNETLGFIKSMLNFVIGFSFLLMLIFEYYKVLLYCLGVGSQLVGEATSYEEQTVDIDSEIAHVTTLPTGERRASITHSFGRTTRRRH